MDEENRGIQVVQSVTIRKSADELYALWRELEKLPTIMRHLESVEVADERLSHWQASGPMNMTIRWDAEIVDDQPGRRLAWRSLKGARVPNEGAVEFSAAPADQGTEVRVALTYRPPLGALGKTFARLFGEEPSQQVREDLKRLQQRLETGEIATVIGQTSGRES